MNPGERTQLANTLNAIHPLPEAELQQLLSGWETVEFKRKALILSEGEVQRSLYFVLEGIQMAYRQKDAREHVTAFTYPPSLAAVPGSFLEQQPSQYFYQALTPSRMLALSYEALMRLVEESREIERLLFRMTQGFLIGALERQFELQALSIEERLRIFFRRSGHLIHMVPHKHIASYLGMDPTNFSKLINQVRL